jgi:hypothetical protein
MHGDQAEKINLTYNREGVRESRAATRVGAGLRVAFKGTTAMIRTPHFSDVEVAANNAISGPDLEMFLMKLNTATLGTFRGESPVICRCGRGVMGTLRLSLSLSLSL